MTFIFKLVKRSPSGGAESYETRTVSIRTTVDFSKTPEIQRFLEGKEAQIICDVESSGLAMTTEVILFSYLFSKCNAFTKFLPKKRESKFP